MKNYLSLIKFSHTVFAMPFALIGFFLAIEVYAFEWATLLYIIFCMIFARSAAMGFNRYIDRHIDAANPRTSKIREIPNGTIKAKSALIFVIINMVLFVLTTYFINPLCFALSPITLIIIIGYSYTKKFTFLCHLVLGIALSLAPIGSYLAVSGQFNLLPILFSFSVIFWVSGFDIIYALQDEEFDKSQKLYSIPVLLGRKNALVISRIFHILTIIILVITGEFGEFNYLYWIGLSIFSILLYYQQSLIRINNISNVNIIFFTTNGIASIVFSTFVILDLIL